MGKRHSIDGYMTRSDLRVVRTGVLALLVGAGAFPVALGFGAAGFPVLALVAAGVMVLAGLTFFGLVLYTALWALWAFLKISK